MDTHLLEVRTGRRPSVEDLTPGVMAFCRSRGDGLLSVFAPHSTCGVALIERGAGSVQDLLAALESILPRGFGWRHRHGSPGHGADHVMPVIVSPSLVLPVLDGQPALGVWQSVVLVDPNRDNSVRKVRLSFIPA
ncbi:MAG: YjbQ family protein [Acidimicrobiia bacterium]|nr:YjbQ family protein [bacterium]MDE0674229.1 YjbQ family protein [bacterium]MXX46131.1 YjbQ family protein [Acidimicrobiia bacterium]MYJ15817.1 YjbQ family protein [Acidimicrobiia bacterium]